MFRPLFCVDRSFSRVVLFIVALAALMLVSAASAGATEPVPSTPTAWEYTHETAPATERQPVASSAADLRLATGISIAAVMVIATVLVSERQGDDAVREVETSPARNVTRQPAPIRSLAPAKALPEAA